MENNNTDNNKNKRVILIVMDSFGIGEAPDAALFGDASADTMRSCYKSKYFRADNLRKMGLFNIDGIDYDEGCKEPIGAFARMTEASAGKDTTIGHWEIAGIISDKPLPTYPEGFPDEVLDEFKKQTGRGVLCNKPYSGTVVINEYGDEHVRTGDLIVYTSADSVFQIAAHEDIVPCEELYEYCRIARRILTGKHGVGRVIARPFIGGSGDYKRTANRHDFSLVPPKKTMLDHIKDAGLDSIAVGKIHDIFAGTGLTDFVYTKGNAEGIERTAEYMKKDFNGLLFVNLVDYDMLYGHRRDIDGYAKAVAYFDEKLPELFELMRDDDVLMITADHGCDPGFMASTDHTREYTPYLLYGKNIEPQNLGTRKTFADIAATVLDYLDVPAKTDGTSLYGCVKGISQQ
ncbi:MAG: phosphopentomutase [Lachnospiraceae bacterium]|nr:phosphopentomutase [Lachnospiraceae bacterium]